MKWKHYCVLCVAVAVLVVVGILLFPAFSNLIEAVLIGFLSTNA